MSRKIMAIILASMVGIATMVVAGCNVDDEGAPPPGGDQPAAPME